MLPVVVLAGGLGTRMRPHTEALPKAMLPVLGRPFVDWQLELLRHHGVDRVTYCIGHHGAILRSHVEGHASRGITFEWVDEGTDRRGTGGALRLALDAGALDPAFFLLYGDSYLEADMRAVQSAWQGERLPALMTVLRNDDRWDKSNAILEDGVVTLYDKSRPADRRDHMHWIDYGLSILTADVVQRIPANTVFDIGDLARELSLEGLLGGYEVSERFFEIGSPAGLADLERHLSERLM